MNRGSLGVYFLAPRACRCSEATSQAFILPTRPVGGVNDFLILLVCEDGDAIALRRREILVAVWG